MSINNSSNKKRSKFNLSHEVKLTADLGKLIPVLCDPVTPGDTFDISVNSVVRFAPLLAPLMHQVDVFFHFYFCPDRLLHDEFEKFITGGEHGDDSTVSPYIEVVDSPGTPDTVSKFVKGSLADYFGMPLYVDTYSSTLRVDAKPFTMYSLIYNEYYRQQDLQDPLDINLASGENTTVNLDVKLRNWNKDYFTRALPFQQKGAAVALPLSGNAPVRGLGIRKTATSIGSSVDVYETGANSVTYDAGQAFQAGTTTSNILFTKKASGVLSAPDIYADMSGVSSATVNDLRKAFQLQRHLERNMRCGARLTEFIQANFGVHNEDYRLQRPEFLGGGRSHVVFSEVLQTSSTDGTSPQGNMAGHGFSTFNKGRFIKSFTEHGWVMCLMSIMPKSSYSSQGLDRKFSRETRFDYILPDFVHLGEQAILRREIRATGNPASDTSVWGYVPYYDHERRRLSRVCGDFRDDLDFWHLARKWDNTPYLNDSFLRCSPRTNIYVEEDTLQKIRVFIYFKYFVVRMLPKYGTPGYIDH